VTESPSRTTSHSVDNCIGLECVILYLCDVLLFLCFVCVFLIVNIVVVVVVVIVAVVVVVVVSLFSFSHSLRVALSFCSDHNSLFQNAIIL